MDQVDLVVDSDALETIPNYTIDNPDLVLENGDFAVVTGNDQIRKSIIRKLKARAESYKILITTYEENNPTSPIVVVEDGKDYGSNLGVVISEPINAKTINTIKTIISNTLETDERITLNDTNVTFVPYNGSIRVDITYTINSTQAVQTASEEITPQP